MLFERVRQVLRPWTAADGTGEDGAAISMRKIIKKFKTSAGDVTVLKGIDTSFYPSEFVGVVGKSGSGKSTLVNMLTGIDRPTSGEVQVGDTMIHHLSESQMARWRALNLGIVFQFYQLLPVLSLLENTMLAMDLANQIPPARRETRARELLSMVGLEKVAHKMPAAVSGGQQQAAAIARAMANDPPFIIADEPTGNLDSRTAENIFQIFENLVDRGKTIIMVTHDPNLASRTTRTLLLCDGEVIHPAIASALPWLAHPLMLKATHRARPEQYQPGERIQPQGEPVEAFGIVAGGAVELREAGNPRSKRLASGQFFGQMALLRGRPARAGVFAADNGPADILWVGREAFLALAAYPSSRDPLATGEGGL